MTEEKLLEKSFDFDDDEPGDRVVYVDDAIAYADARVAEATAELRAEVERLTYEVDNCELEVTRLEVSRLKEQLASLRQQVSEWKGSAPLDRSAAFHNGDAEADDYWHGMEDAYAEVLGLLASEGTEADEPEQKTCEACLGPMTAWTGQSIHARCSAPVAGPPGEPLDSGITPRPGHPGLSKEARQRVADKVDSVNEALRRAGESSHSTVIGGAPVAKPSGLWREIEEAEATWEQMPDWVKRESEPLFREYERAVAKRRAEVAARDGAPATEVPDV